MKRLEFFATILYSTSDKPDIKEYAERQTEQLKTKLESSIDKKKEVNDVISKAKGEAAYYKIYQEYMKNTYQKREQEMKTKRENAIADTINNDTLMKEIERDANDEITGIRS